MFRSAKNQYIAVLASVSAALGTCPLTSGGELAAADSVGGEGTLEEVVVTAQKRQQDIQEVPISMSVVDPVALVENNQVKLNDFYASVPGLSVAPSFQQGQSVAIRGIATNAFGATAGSATTGILIDDVPFGAGELLAPDFDPGDLQRIEVLRGPQGTLYGSSAVGGIVKYVTVDPSTEKMTGRLEAGTDSVYNGAQLGYTFRGSVNVPVTSELAVRASAFTRQDAGYIDNPVFGLRGINEDHASGGYLSLLWHPADGTSLKVYGMYQRVAGDSSSDITTAELVSGQLRPLGDLQQGYTRNANLYLDEIEAFGMTLKKSLGDFELASITGYNSNVRHNRDDDSSLVGFLSQQQFGVGGFVISEDYGDKAFSEELRLSGPLGRHLDEQLGLYYAYSKRDPDNTTFLPTDPLTGNVVGQWGGSVTPGYEDESAVFGDLTYHVTDRFDLQFGGRESRVRAYEFATATYGLINPDLFNPSSPSTAPIYTVSPSQKSTAFTYLLSPQLKLSPDLMIYARLASGFQPGGSNGFLAKAYPGVPEIINPAKTYNYELGSKADFLNHKLTVDAAIYYIDWSQIQVTLLTPDSAFAYAANAGRAKSEGLELSVNARPAEGLRLGAWFSYDDAAITEYPASAVGFYAAPGNPLPYAAKFSGNVSADQEFPLTTSIVAFVGGTIAYIGDRESLFTGTATRTYLPPYAKTDFRLGARYGLWKANIYVNNATDRRGVISGGLGSVISQSFYIIQPRTIGLNVSRTFE